MDKNPSSDFKENSISSLGYEIPSYGVQLTKEQYDLVKEKKMEFYSINGYQLFPIKDIKGDYTGEYMLYIVWT